MHMLLYLIPFRLGQRAVVESDDRLGAATVTSAIGTLLKARVPFRGIQVSLCFVMFHCDK